MGGKRRGGGGGNSSSRGSNSNSNSKRNDNKYNNEDKTPQSSTSTTDDTTFLDNANLDFCQRFFGDPLFSNRNVSLLFVFATVLPMLAWLPHFVSEYRRLRQIQYLEEERQFRMQNARMEVEHQQRKLDGIVPSGTDDDEGGIYILDDPGLSNSKFDNPNYDPSKHSSSGSGGIFSRHTAQETFRPTLCPDGKTIGYDNWFILRDAISEVNTIAAEEFLRWNEYLMIAAKNSSLEPPVYTPPEPFVVCPGVTLNQKSLWGSIFSPSYWASSIYSILPNYIFGSSSTSSSTTTTNHHHHGRATPKSKNKLSSIFINAEDITIECVMCTVDLPGTHFSFGPHARNVKIKGFTFRGATSSSLTFHHHGADVHLEDCYWLYNSGGVVSNNRAPHANVNGADGIMSPPPGSSTTAGAVADLNSTSTVAFYRCVIDDQKQSPRKATTGAGVANVPGMNPPAGHVAGGGGISGGQAVASSSFTIRN